MFGDNLENHFSACDVTCGCAENVLVSKKKIGSNSMVNCREVKGNILDITVKKRFEGKVTESMKRNNIFFKFTILKKWSFLLWISSANVTKSAVFCGFGRIFWRNSYRKLHFLCCETKELDLYNFQETGRREPKQYLQEKR